MMKCPSCSHIDLEPYSCNETTVDICPECYGVWCDEKELNDLVQFLRAKGHVTLPRTEKIFPAVSLGVTRPSKEKICPKCDAELSAFNYYYDSNIFLDRCYACNGIWIDGGKLDDIIAYIKGNPTVNQFADAYGEYIVSAHRQKTLLKILGMRFIALLFAIGTFFPRYRRGIISNDYRLYQFVENIHNPLKVLFVCFLYSLLFVIILYVIDKILLHKNYITHLPQRYFVIINTIFVALLTFLLFAITSFIKST